MKYRNKPVIIEAVQINNNVKELQDFIGNNGTVFQDERTIIVSINILDMVVTGTNGTYIVKVGTDMFYPCPKDIFEATYEDIGEEKDEKNNGSRHSIRNSVLS